jgi:tRNA pseudouridine38-40 synthase
VEADFHARFSARSREYRYRIWCGRRSPLLLRRIVWHVQDELDQESMGEAASILIGKHDVRSFAGKGLGTPEALASTVRNVTRSEWNAISADLEHEGGKTRVLEYRVEANAFLPHMVRNIVGSLVEVGRRRITVRDFREILERRDRRIAPPPATPQGLVLWRVRYDEDDEDRGSSLKRPPRGVQE